MDDSRLASGKSYRVRTPSQQSAQTGHSDADLLLPGGSPADNGAVAGSPQLMGSASANASGTKKLKHALSQLAEVSQVVPSDVDPIDNGPVAGSPQLGESTPGIDSTEKPIHAPPHLSEVYQVVPSDVGPG